MPIGEYEFEAERGLPEELPAGEEILWQGSPDWRGLARRVFYTRWVAVYFAVVLIARLSTELAGDWTFQGLGMAMAWVIVPAAAALSLLALFAWLNARATVYTLTNRRIVIRLGVALQLSVNLPFARVLSADLVRHGDGTGDIALDVRDAEQIGFVMMWPHVKPWRFGADFRISMRCIPEADHVGEVLAAALATSAPARPEVVVSLEPRRLSDAEPDWVYAPEVSQPRGASLAR